jgi:hypothetical protein
VIKPRHLSILCGVLLAIGTAQPSFGQGLTIDQLGAAGTLGDSDLVPVEQGGTPPAKKMTLAQLKSYLMDPPVGPAFYVATNGSDGNDGTAPTSGGGHGPFATLTKCQSAMQGNSTKTCYLRAGIYNLAAIASGCWWGGSGTCGVVLTSSDNGETFATYPPDGCDAAIINGQSTGIGSGLWVLFSGVNAPNNVTINCLTLENFQFASISLASSSGSSSPNAVTISNNIIQNQYYNDISGPTGGSGIQCYNCTNMAISHNAILNTQGRGLSVQGSTAGASISGLTVTGNYVAKTCQGIQDCGAIYGWDYPSALSTNITITNNFVRDGNPNITGAPNGGAGSGIYLDNCLSHVIVSGNIVTGMEGGSTIQHNGGIDDTWSGNILDLESFGRANAQFLQAPSTNPSYCGLTTAGNAYTGNIIIATGGGGTWSGTGTTGAGTLPTIKNNDYYAYAGGTPSSSAVGNNPQPDSNPQNVNPQLSGCYSIASGSPAFSSPINFAPIVGGWGPPGYTIPPASGRSVPSYPSPTC